MVRQFLSGIGQFLPSEHIYTDDEFGEYQDRLTEAEGIPNMSIVYLVNECTTPKT